jgi:hypothetical protein
MSFEGLVGAEFVKNFDGVYYWGRVTAKRRSMYLCVYEDGDRCARYTKHKYQPILDCFLGKK